MNNPVIDQAVLEELKKEARRETAMEALGDDFNPMDLSGGNFDDAFSAGEETGFIEGVRWVLDKIGVSYQ